MRTPHRWPAHLVSVACIGVAAIAPASADAAGKPALEPGVHVDPGSPAAKEYAIPLQQARSASPPTTGGSRSGGSGGSRSGGSGGSRSGGSGGSGSGGSGGSGSGGSSSGLFGGGITPAKTKVSIPAARTPGGAQSVSKGSAPHHGSAPTATLVGAPPAVPVFFAHAGRSGSGIGWMLGAGLFVLLVGGLGGIVLARVRRRAGAGLS